MLTQNLLPLVNPFPLQMLIISIGNFSSKKMIYITGYFLSKDMVKNYRYGLHQNWNMTLLILNLAVADLAYCIFSLPLNAAYYFSDGLPLGHEACYAFAGHLAFSNSFVGVRGDFRKSMGLSYFCVLFHFCD
jgi:hypothetical protein